MHSTRIFMNGASQAVRLPAEYRFENPEVCITRIGSMVIIYPKDQAWDLLQSAIGSVTDDFKRPEQGAPDHDLSELDPTPAASRARVYRTKKSTAPKPPSKSRRKSA